jgi:hypothetical protein
LVCTFFVFRDTVQQDGYFTEDASLIEFPCRFYHFHPIISICNRCLPLFLISNFHTSFDTLCNLKSEVRQQQTLSQIARFVVFCTHFAIIVLLYQIWQNRTYSSRKSSCKTQRCLIPSHPLPLIKLLRAQNLQTSISFSIYTNKI